MANLSHLPEQWRTSGLTQRAFCEREGVKLATFAYWRREELHDGAPTSSTAGADPAPAAFTELRLPSGPGAARRPEVHYPDGTVVRVPV